LNYLAKNNNKSITNLSARLDRLSDNSESTSDYVIKSIGKGSSGDVQEYWKGRKIIPLNEWKKIANTNYALGVPDNVRKEAEKWLSDYLDLMEFKMNANYGKTKCAGCLLDPEMDGSTLHHRLSRIVAKGLVVIDEIKEEQEGNENREIAENKSQGDMEMNEKTIVVRRNNNNKFET
jgi:hypothetical protein